MNDPRQLTDLETFWLGSLLVLLVGCMVWANRSRDPRAWIQPPLVMALIYAYYTVAGPLNALNQERWWDREADLRSGMVMGWAGACISFLAFLVGYAVIQQRVRPPRFNIAIAPIQVHQIGQRLNLIGLIMFGLVEGGRLILYLNPVGVAESRAAFEGINVGGFENYFLLCLNLLVPGCLLMAAAWIQRRDFPLPLVLWILVTMAIFTSVGFRWRIAVLAGSLVMLWFIALRIRPNLKVVIPSLFGLLFMAGLMEITREYGQGLDLSLLKGKSFTDILLASFNESHVFLTSGSLIELTPKSIPFAGLTPFINTLLFPIPSALLPTKDSARYILNATEVIYNSDFKNAGSVLLNYAEYFLIGGWPALIILSILLGWLCRRLWLWFRVRGADPLAQVIYVCNAGYLYMVVSRGYMPQVVMLWVFTAAPLFAVYAFLRRSQLIYLRSRLPRTTKRLLPPHLLNQRPLPSK